MENLLIQMILFLSFKCCFDYLINEGQVDIYLKKTDAKILITEHYEGKPVCDDSTDEDIQKTKSWESLNQNLLLIKGSVNMDSSNHEILISIPATL